MVLTGIVESSEGVVSAGMWVSLVEGSPAQQDHCRGNVYLAFRLATSRSHARVEHVLLLVFRDTRRKRENGRLEKLQLEVDMMGYPGLNGKEILDQ